MNEEFKIYRKTRQNVWEISNFGNVKKNGIILDISNCDNHGYYQVGGHYYVHRMVAETFIPNTDNKPEVDHIDGNKHNNNVNNLRWVTSSENKRNTITYKKLCDERRSRGPISEDHKQKIIDKWKDPEYRNKVCTSLKEASNKPEVKKKRSDAQKISKSKPEVKKRISDSLRNSKKFYDALHSESYHNNMSKALKGGRPMNNGIETHRFHETEQIKMLELGWTYGYAKKSILDNKNIS